LEEQKQLKIALAEMVALQKKGDGIFTVKELIDTIERIRKVPEQAPELSRARKQTLRKIIDGRSIKDFVYQDARAIEEQRKMHFQDPATKTLMKMLFPGGKKDLANLGIPEHMRLTAWKLMKTDVFPIAIQTIVKTALDEANIKTMISSALKSAQETLEGEIVLDSSIPDDPSKDKLDDASGELIGAMLEMIELPAVLKNRLRDKKTGEVSSALKQAIGASLRKQFNGNFIEDALKSALKSAAQRDPVTGEPTITIDTSSEESKKLKREEKIAELDLKIQQQVYDVVDTSVSYAIKNLWVKAQAKFDQLVLKAFGKIGLKLKQALDSIFRFIFFKLIGTALEFIYDKTMLKALIKKMFHSLLSLDANRQKILDFLTHTPDNQPIGSHPLHLEALGYNLARAVRLSVEEALRGGHSSIVENDVDIPPGLFQ
jgi:hypothetical protein